MTALFPMLDTSPTDFLPENASTLVNPPENNCFALSHKSHTPSEENKRINLPREEDG